MEIKWEFFHRSKIRFFISKYFIWTFVMICCVFISAYIDAEDWPAVICCCFVSSTVSEWLRGGAGGQTRQDDLCMQRLLFICKGIYRDRFWEVIFRWSGRSVFRPELTGLYISIPLFLYLSLHRSIFYFPLVSNSIFPSKTHPSAYALWLSLMSLPHYHQAPSHRVHARQRMCTRFFVKHVTSLQHRFWEDN